ncbi:MAG: DUF6152 family protein [Steroidobacteraceae bacterium]
MARFIPQSVAVGLLGALGIHSATAHHSYAMFDMTQQRTLEGALYSMEWKNPHSWIWVAVTNDKGEQKVWGFEGGSTQSFIHMGLTKDDLTVGRKVLITYRPLKDGQQGGQFVSMTFADGTTIR